MNQVTWNNKMQSRGRCPVAIIVGADGSVAEFRTTGVLGQYAVHEAAHEQCGKWSNSTYRITLGEGVRFFTWTPDFDTGKSFANCETWSDVYAEVFGVVGLPLDKSSLMACLRVMKSGLARRLDDSEAILESLSETRGENMGDLTLVSTVVAPSFSAGRLELTPVSPDELPMYLASVTRNLCGHPVTDGVLRAVCPTLPTPERAFWTGEGHALAVRPKGGVRASQVEGDTQVTLNDLEAALFYWESR